MKRTSCARRPYSSRSRPWNLIGNYIISNKITSVIAGACRVVDVTVAVMLSGSTTLMNIWLIGALAVPVALVVIGIPVTLIASAVRSHR